MSSDWFELDEPVPFMEKVFPIKPERHAEIPAVTHVDGSGRLQSVYQDVAPRYHALISAFHAKTGVPILLNTSFNENEPIVNAPEHALACYQRTSMDMLGVGELCGEKMKFNLQNKERAHNHHLIPKEIIELGENEDSVTIIPWPLKYSYRHSVKGKPDKHYSQPVMLHHAQFLCAEHELGSHILHVDVDEYIIGGQPLSTLASEKLTTEFVNYWAFNPPGTFGPQETKTLFNKGDSNDAVRRKKQLKPIAPFEPRCIHGSKHLD
jgi:hypothetical protein